MLRDITVLITAAGNVFMPGTTACLKNNGERNIRLIGVDMNDDKSMLQMVDAYYQVPRGDDPCYVERLLEICRKEKVDILLPIMSVELEALSINRHCFEKIGTRVSVSELKSLSIANNKLDLFRFMSSHDIRCADYREVRTIEELDNASAEMGYPDKKICVKAVSGSGSRGFRILDEHHSRFDAFIHDKPNSSIISLNDMKSILSEARTIPTMILMEYLPGNEYTVDLVADHGSIKYACCRKSLGMQDSIMLDSIVVDNEEVLELCSKVAEMLCLDGNIGFDVRDNVEGVPYIMECNPRITAGIPVFAAAGVNLPYLNVKRLLGEQLPVCCAKLGIIAKRRWQEMYVEG